MNNLLIIIAIVALFVLFMCKNKENLYGDIIGNNQRMYSDPRDERICHTDYSDENCKFAALNCANNQESLFYNE